MSGEYVQKMNADEGYAGDLDALRYVKCMVVKLRYTADFIILWFVVVFRVLPCCLQQEVGDLIWRGNWPSEHECGPLWWLNPD